MRTNLKIILMFLFLSAVAFGVTGSHMIIDSGSTTAVTQATGTNLHVVVDSAPSTTVTGPLTDTQLRNSAVPVSLAAVPSHAVTNAGTFAVQATLAAETTKVIGTVNQGTSPWVGSTILTTGSAQIGHLEANQSSNIAQINAVTPLMGNGTTGTGSQRVTIASDNTPFHVIHDSGSTTACTQATGTNLHAVLDSTSTTAVTQATGTNLHAVLDANSGVDIGKLTANQSVNVAQINGVTTLMGIGASGTGAQRVTLSSDSTGTVELWDGTNTASVKAASTVSAATDKSLVVVQVPGGGNPCQNPSSNVVGISGATSTTNATQIIALSGSTKIYLCSMTITGVSGTTPTFSLVTGTGSNCANSQLTLVGAWTTTANTLYQFSYMVAIAPSGTAVCYKDGGTSPVQNYTITYVQQ